MTCLKSLGYIMQMAGLEPRHLDSQLRTNYVLLQTVDLKDYIQKLSFSCQIKQADFMALQAECVWACLGSVPSLLIWAVPFFP